MVLISIAAVGPAVWSHSVDLVREHTVQLLFAALATGLCIVERGYARRGDEAEIEPQLAADAPATRAAPRFRA